MKRAWLLVFVFSGCGLIVWPGKPCRKHEECGGLKDAYCSRAEICTRECDDARPCPEDSTCFATPVRSVCLPSCEANGDCQTGFDCREGVCQLTKPFDPPPL